VSLYKTVPATKANSGTITAALAAHTRDASRILRAAGYRVGGKAKPGAKLWAGALATEPPGSETYRAAWRLLCVRQCRDALAAGDAVGAAWAAYTLAETYGRDVVDGFEKPIRHVAKLRERQRNNPGPGLAEGIATLARQEREAHPQATAKELWRAVRDRVHAAGDDGLQVNGCKIQPLPAKPPADELVQTDAGGKTRVVTFKAFADRYAPPRR
jgi:hypothetical protein